MATQITGFKYANFFFFRHIKNKVYSRSVESREELLATKRRCFAELNPDHVRKFTKDNDKKIIQKCRELKGNNIEHL